MKMSCTSCCCCCCTSTRGASFFCTSVHIFIGMYLSLKWIVVGYANGTNADYFEDHRMSVIYPLLLIYLAIFLVLGCVNFFAVDRESAGTLKWSMRALIFLQISMLLTNTLLAFAFPEHDNDLAVHRFYHIKFMVINVVTTSIYCYIVRRFIFSLEHEIYIVHKKKKKCSTANPSGNLDSRPTAPWTNSVDRFDPRQDTVGSSEEEQKTPLKCPAVKEEPQPCSSKS